MHVLQIHEDSLCISQMTSLSSSQAQTPSSAPIISNNLCDNRNYSSFTWTILSYYFPQTEFLEDIVFTPVCLSRGGGRCYDVTSCYGQHLPQTTPSPWTAPPWTTPPRPPWTPQYPIRSTSGWYPSYCNDFLLKILCRAHTLFFFLSLCSHFHSICPKSKIIIQNYNNGCLEITGNWVLFCKIEWSSGTKHHYSDHS